MVRLWWLCTAVCRKDPFPPCLHMMCCRSQKESLSMICKQRLFKAMLEVGQRQRPLRPASLANLVWWRAGIMHAMLICTLLYLLLTCGVSPA